MSGRYVSYQVTRISHSHLPLRNAEEGSENLTGEVGLCAAAHRGYWGSCWELEPRGSPGVVEVADLETFHKALEGEILIILPCFGFRFVCFIQV